MCRFGKNCTYAHGQDDLRQPYEDMTPEQIQTASQPHIQLAQTLPAQAQLSLVPAILQAPLLKHSVSNQAPQTPLWMSDSLDLTQHRQQKMLRQPNQQVQFYVYKPKAKPVEHSADQPYVPTNMQLQQTCVEGIIASPHQFAPKSYNGGLFYPAQPQLQSSQSWDGSQNHYERIHANRIEVSNQ